MVYFRCTSSGSGKGNTVIVTCAEQFAGVAITIAKIGKSYTKVCPLSAPYVVKFYGVEAGTYTVSATVSGQTYSETVIVQDVSCVLNYGFTWKTWVDTAQYLDSTDYASLSEVLADEEAVRELFLEHACVDYMADSGSSNADLETIIDNDLCAKWINNSDYALDYLGANTALKALMDEADKYGYGEWVNNNGTWEAKGNVPIMTSNTAPYGVVTSSGDYSSTFAAYKAFNGTNNDSNDCWISSQNSIANAYLCYKSPNPICVKAIKLVNRNSELAAAIKNFKLQGSNDGTTWTDIATLQNPNNAQSQSVVLSVANDIYYLMHRILVVDAHTEHSSDYVSIGELQFYGRELSVSVPTMTSNTAPYGEASASSAYSSSSDYQAFNVFHSSSNDWYALSSDNSPWIQYKFTRPTCIKQGYMQTEGQYGNGTWELVGSNDGSNWSNTLATFTFTTSTSNQSAIENATNSQGYLYYRLKRTSGSNVNPYSAILRRVQFYGLDYSEKEFEAGTTKKWLYDHGVELESMEMPEYTGNSFVGSTIEKLSSSIKLNVGSNTYGGCGVITSDKINLNAFDLIRMKISEFGSTSSSSNVAISVVSNKTGANPTNIANASFTRGNSNIPYNMSLDISSVNEEDYVLAIVGNAPSFSAEMSELWLE